MDPDEYIPAEVTAFRIGKNSNGVMEASQNSYLDKIDELPLSAYFAHFRSMRITFA